ncbi:hypothetical protein KUTeg_015507 [Tegillarca granosa]|uniref:NADH dehydrogenase subunit 5 n=1 Tax=Tegillarca granosa TaxID=220873 RepID=A0ABQ9EVU3_TEGGR|nr:hypothetical protein KUTeg_015507 [Tegillarca granosa]
MNYASLAATTAFPSLLAVTWFPPQQRTTATAMSLISFNVGMSISFILGSKVVQTPRYETVANFVNISIENSTSKKLTYETSVNKTIAKYLIVTSLVKVLTFIAWRN